jgi:hypothetical protein
MTTPQLLIFAAVAVLRFIIPSFDLLLLIWLVSAPKNKVDEPQFITFVIISSVISSFISDNPLGVLPFASAVMFMLFQPLTPVLINRGVERTLIWFFQLVSIALISRLISLLLTTGTVSLPVEATTSILLTTVTAIVLRILTKKRAL